MAVAKIFNVLTEFRFETGSAIASTGALQNAVQGVSTAADQALISFERLSIGIIGSFTGGGGLLGIMGTAISSSEKFLKTQVALANVLGRGSGSFADRMAFAEGKMDSIVKKARMFGLPSEALAGITKVLTPILAPKLGGAKAIDTSIDLGRSFLKAAPTLGMDPFMAQDNLQRAMLGTIDSGDQLFMTLTQDTKAMAKFIGNADKFRKLPMAERVKVLTEALGEFSGDTEAVERMLNSVGGQMQVLRDSLTGIGSVLKPLGDVLSKPIVRFLKHLNKIIQEDIGKLIKDLSLAIEPFTRDLRRMLATFMSLRSLGGDVSSAGNIMLKIGMITGLASTLSWLGIKIPIISLALNAFAGVVGFFGKSLATGAFAFLNGPSKGLLGFLNGIFVFVTRLIVPLALLVGVFQFLSRTAAHAKIMFAEMIAKFAISFSDMGLLFARIFSVFDQGFDTLAKWTAKSAAMEFVFEILGGLVTVLEGITTAVAFAIASFQGMIFALGEMHEQVWNLLTPGKTFDPSQVGRSFDAGVEGMLSELFPKIAAKMGDGTALAQQSVHIGKVEIKNDFKDLMQPDRVAFTIKDQLLKAARNATGSKVTNFGGTQALANGGGK